MLAIIETSVIIKYAEMYVGKKGALSLPIGLLIVYAKAKFDNLPSDFLSVLKQEFIND
ncbi:hypothetical protein [Methylophilus sp. 3sh_L]|uniref:hypothetical protein n=1 Tax=Methylophilus sp. 3sh_L TaxID=3377114 RepID=UPI00398F3148